VIVDLGELPAGALGGDYGINDWGYTVGSLDDASGHEHAYMWDPNGVGYDLGTLGGSFSGAYGIADTPQRHTVGWSTDAANASKATLWTSLAPGALPYLPGYSSSAEAWGISSTANYISGVSRAPSTSSHAAVWEGATTWDVGEGVLYSINNAGQAAGFRGTHALFAYKVGAAYVSTTDIDGGLFATSWAYDINDAGRVIGFAKHLSTHPTRPNYLQAYRWDSTAGLVLLPTDLGTHSWAYGLNDSGDAVGAFEGLEGKRACLWDLDTADAPLDLNTLIDPDGGWFLVEAKDVNDDGWVVGWGKYRESASDPWQYRGYLLRPAPGLPAFALVGVAPLVAAVLRRRRSK
jgi:probable HAF family extracellular repeat protein